MIMISSNVLVMEMLIDGVGPMQPRLITLKAIPCGKQHSVCEADVVLNESLRVDDVYELSLSVRDTSGGVTSVSSTIQVTNASVALDSAFQHLNQFITVPEVITAYYNIV